MLPIRGWAAYEATIKAIGERRSPGSPDSTDFLHSIGMLAPPPGMALSEAGSAYFRAKFILRDDAAAKATLSGALLGCPPALAIAQLLGGVPDATRDAAESLLRSQGFGHGLNARSLGSLLTLMDRAGMIEYSPRHGTFNVRVHLSEQDSPPSSVFISPQTPFGNRVWLRRILQEATGYLYWLDKHFLAVAFESLWEAVDGKAVNDVRILSLYLEDYHRGRKVKRDYLDLQRELSGRGVKLEWRVIDSSAIRDTHDRWLVSSSSARNIPNVNAIFSGQHSELNTSDQRDELERLFNRYWSEATDITLKWGPLQD